MHRTIKNLIQIILASLVYAMNLIMDLDMVILDDYFFSESMGIRMSHVLCFIKVV